MPVSYSYMPCLTVHTIMRSIYSRLGGNAVAAHYEQQSSSLSVEHGRVRQVHD